MFRLELTVLAAILVASPLRAEQDSIRSRADSLRALFRPLAQRNNQLRVIENDDNRYVVEHPRLWLDTLRRPELIDAVQVRGNSAKAGAMTGAIVGLLGGALSGGAAGVALNNMCLLGGCPSRSAASNLTAGAVGGAVGAVGGALIGTGVGALIGLAIPAWHTRVRVRPDGRIEIR